MMTDAPIFDELKTRGNSFYQLKDYESALDSYKLALQYVQEHKIQVPVSPIHVNMALCYNALHNYATAITHCKVALQYDYKYEKAYFRLIKCLYELSKYQEARLYLLRAFKICGEKKDLKSLEIEYNTRTKLILRPSPNHFDVLNDQVGDGNFSKIYKVSNKSVDKRIFAIKVIEKPTIEKTRRRHPNVDNEIMMEKKVLSRLTHPNIIQMYATFQDTYTLYYQMEYIYGGELWASLYDTFMGHRVTVGLPMSQAIFVFAELLNAVEYMHSRGVVHRDLKPENILIKTSGHIKVIDFGTAKDLIQTDLNGPHFVGTADYMSPDTIDGKITGIESDLWAIGIILYQLLFGITPFYAPTPYLNFLRIKKGIIRIPPHAPEGLVELLNILLDKNSHSRFHRITSDQPHLIYEDYLGENTNTTTSTTDTTTSSATVSIEDESIGRKENKIYVPPNYDTIRLNPIFNLLYDTSVIQMTEFYPYSTTSPIFQFLNSPNAEIDIKVVTNDNADCIKEMKPAVSVHPKADDDSKNHNNNSKTSSMIRALDDSPWSQEDMDWLTGIHLSTTKPLYTTTVPSTISTRIYTTEEKARIDFIRNVHVRPAVRVPKLAELCIKVVAEACVVLTEAIAQNGGNKPDISWMKKFSLLSLSLRDQYAIYYYLHRHHRMHNPNLNRLFYTTAIDARSRRADLYQREYTGYTQNTQGLYTSDYHCIICCDPIFGYDISQKGDLVISLQTSNTATITATITSSFTNTTTDPNNNNINNCNIDNNSIAIELKEEEALKGIISSINKLRPKFLLVHGNFTAFGDHSSPLYDYTVQKFRRTMARVLDTIPVLYIPGYNDVTDKHLVTPESLAYYRRNYGADYYGFWYSGTRILVINSTLLAVSTDNEIIQQEKQRHIDWFDEELQQAKLSATHVIICSYHSWISSPPPSSEDDKNDRNDNYNSDKEDSTVHITVSTTTSITTTTTTTSTVISNTNDATTKGLQYILPSEVRTYWLHKMRHPKVEYIFSSSSSSRNMSIFDIKREIKLNPINNNDNAKKDDVESNMNEERKDVEESTAEMTSDNEDEILENTRDDYEGPYLVTTPSVTSVSLPLNKEYTASTTTNSTTIQNTNTTLTSYTTTTTTSGTDNINTISSNSILLDMNEYCDIENTDNHMITAPGDDEIHAYTVVHESGIRILSVTETAMKQTFYSKSHIPTRATVL